MNALATLALMLVAAQAPQPKPPPASPPPPAPAETPPPPAAGAEAGQPSGLPVLTLDQVLDLAERQNYDLQAAKARLRQADELTWKAWSGYLPQLTGGASYQHNNAAAVLPPGVFGPEAITLVPLDQIGAQARVEQALIVPQLWFVIPQAKRADEIARLSTEGARRQILFGVAQAYYGVAALREAVSVTERLLEIAQRQEKDARVRYQAGAVAKVGLIRAEIDRARAEQDLVRARNSYESGRIALATLLSRPPDFDIADPPAPQLVAAAGELEAAAQRDRTDVLASQANVEAQRLGRNGILATYLPNLGAFGQYQIANATQFTGKDYSWYLGVGLQWKFFDGGLREANLREANAKIDEAVAFAEGTSLKARQEVQQAVLDLGSARANAAKAKEQRDLAAENQRLVDVAYRAGTSTAVEQADATAQLRTAEISVTAENFNAQVAVLHVLQAAGASHPTRH